MQYSTRSGVPTGSATSTCRRRRSGSGPRLKPPKSRRVPKASGMSRRTKSSPLRCSLPLPPSAPSSPSRIPHHPPMKKNKDLFKGIGFKLISALLFAAMSALVRQLSDVAPVGQMVFFRSTFAVVPVVMIYALRGQLSSSLRTGRPLGQLGRGLLSVCGMFTNFSALTRLPLADVTAISFASPLMTVVLAAIILKERVRAYRWSAVLVGFSGVIVMLIPQFDVGHYAATGVAATAAVGATLATLSAFCNAGTVIQTRRLTQSETTPSIVFYFSIVCAIAGVLTLPFAWHTPTLSELIKLIALGVLGGVAHILLTESYRGAVRLHSDAVGAAARLLDVRRASQRAGLRGRLHRNRCGPIRDLARAAAG